MPHRTFPIWVTVLGVLVVTVGIIFRVNLRRAADSSPAFLRRLVMAGLMCFWSFGFVPAGTAEEAGRWQQLGNTWKQAEEVAEGKRGPFPFDRAGKDKMLQELDGLTMTIATLRADKVISDAEAQLLVLELEGLVRGVQEKRPTELQAATCYEPMMFTPELDSMGRLEKRLPLLAKLEPGKVSPEVWNKLILGLQNDLGILQNPDHLARLKDPQKKQAAEIAASVQKEIDRLGQTTVPVIPPK